MSQKEIYLAGKNGKTKLPGHQQQETPPIVTVRIDRKERPIKQKPPKRKNGLNGNGTGR